MRKRARFNLTVILTALILPLAVLALPSAAEEPVKAPPELLRQPGIDRSLGQPPPQTPEARQRLDSYRSRVEGSRFRLERAGPRLDPFSRYRLYDLQRESGRLRQR